MSTIFTHALTGAAIAAIADDKPSAAALTISAACAVFPDIDGIGYLLGIPYGALFGHRGFLHSMPCAALLAATCALFFRESHPLFHCAVFFAAAMSHGILDAFTDGGLGIAFFSPFDTTRYFFPFRPIEVPPIGIRPSSPVTAGRSSKAKCSGYGSPSRRRSSPRGSCAGSCTDDECRISYRRRLTSSLVMTSFTLIRQQEFSHERKA